MRSFSYIGLKHYLDNLGEFSEITISVFENASRCYKVKLHQLSDLEKLTSQAIFNVDCTKIR
ncbi:hypothetical protein [Loigolactobacillus zhaoyuanensis]|uniref:Uncharacterized protein n=1 Tax=Loigolactobacillus zhaoyuanensis TaxID=2486017 RepID=A0ABW8UF96_9LACO|nr:hypothetical protein [Loigolactobacillus zhaoyuanensis]